MMPGVMARAQVPNELGTRANRRFEIIVDVDRNTSLEAVSFVERVFTYGSFAVSKSHQRRVCGLPTVCPGVEKGWEGIIQLLREPAQRLEISILLPFSLNRDYSVELEVYTLDQGAFVPAPRLRMFSPYRIETNFKAKRIFVTIDEPLVGVGYAVKWELPENDPALGEFGVADRDYQQAIEWAMRFQSKVLRMDEMDHPIIGKALAELIDGHLADLMGVGAAVPEDELEWALFVPERKGDKVITEEGRPLLSPAFANFASTETRWMSWPAGFGVAGRAFALNTEVEAIRPGSSRYSAPEGNEWIEPPMPVYEQKDGSLDHSVLYGLPVRVPGRRHEVVWAVLCVGTGREYSGLDLDKPIPTEPGGPLAPASLVLMKSLTDVFSRKLARYMGQGTGFADSLPA
jgi:hypothetical protein